MLLWIILGTLINCTILFFFTRFFSVNFLKKFIIFNFLISIILTIICFFEIGYFNEMSYLYLFNWVNLGIMKVNLVLLYDTLTIVMIFIVLFISGLVHLYSFSYMSHDPNFFRFIAYLSLFTFFMLVLVTSSNFLQLLIGWEGVGLSSYLLICFWYTRIAANLAAIKAMSVNRIGDIFLLFTIFLIFSFFGSINFGLVFNNVIYLLDFYFDLFFIEIRFIDLVCFFIFLAACGKSAQLLLHIWLPDAMEGPTPVSALIHAATMVTAGVFLVIRCSILFEHSSKILFFMVFLGSLTCFLMSILGAFQQDIKKIVAYSTCSQLGYMFMGCGLSSYNTSFFHLFNHAFFKALLFLSMGVIIHALSDEQDLRKMGNLVNFLPYTIVIVFFGNFALLGLPFLAGFYSKDILIEVAFSRFYFDGSFSYILGLLAAFFTAFYSTRLFIRIFFSYSNFNRYTVYNIHEVDILMFIPLIILLLCSFFVGFFFFDVFIGMGSFFFFDSIFINFLNYSGIYVEFESLINMFIFNKNNFIIQNNSLNELFILNNNLLKNLPQFNIDHYNGTFISEFGTIPLYKKYIDLNLISYSQNNSNLFYTKINSLNIGIFENDIFKKKNFYTEIIRPIVIEAKNEFSIYLNLIDKMNLFVELNEKGENLIPLNQDPLVVLFNNTYGDPDLFYEKLSTFKIVSNKMNVIVNSKFFLENIDKYNIQNFIVDSLNNILEKNNINTNYKNIKSNIIIFSLFNYDLINNIDFQISFYIKILPLIVSILGFSVYYFLDDRFIIYYHNYYYRLIVLKLYNGLFFDKLFIDVLVSKFYFFSYYSFYKNIESSFFQKYNIYIFENNVFSWFFFFKIFSKGYFFVYILIVISFIFFYFFFIFIFNFLNFSFLPLILILFIFSFIQKWSILKDYIKNLYIVKL